MKWKEPRSKHCSSLLITKMPNHSLLITWTQNTIPGFAFLTQCELSTERWKQTAVRWRNQLRKELKPLTYEVWFSNNTGEKEAKGIWWIKGMGEAHNTLKCLLAHKINLPKPRQAKGNGARSAPQNPVPWTPEWQGLSIHHGPRHPAPLVHPRTAPRAALAEPTPPPPREPKAHGLGFGSELLGDLWAPLREGKQCSNKHSKRMIQQEDFLHRKHDEFKFYTDQVSFGHEARDAFLSLSCFLQFPWTYPLTTLHC